MGKAIITQETSYMYMYKLKENIININFFCLSVCKVFRMSLVPVHVHVLYSIVISHSSEDVVQFQSLFAWPCMVQRLALCGAKDGLELDY